MVVATPRHRRSACHKPRAAARWALGAALAAAVGCAPTQGWHSTDRRACAPDSPPVLCLSGDDDGLHELRLGETVVLPGECVVGPDGAKGRLAAELWVSGKPVATRRVGVPAGTHTTVQVDGDRIEVVERRDCDGRVPTPGDE